MNNFKRSFVKKIFLGLVFVLFVLGSAVPSQADDVDVYAEGAYTTGATGDLTVYLYADINVGNLVSFGVKLNYATAKLESPSAEKNEIVWYVGDGTEAGNHAYMDPDISTAGQIIFIGGMLDELDTTVRVTGTRVLLGKVTFSRTDATKTEDPKEDPGGPEGYFGITLTLGRPDPDPPTTTFDNFVDVSADGTVVTVKDDSGVSFNHPGFDGQQIKIAERGDANASGTISSRDLNSLRALLRAGSDYVVYADCNASETLSSRDLNCIRAILRP